jgi:CRISPR-associated protein Cas5t
MQVLRVELEGTVCSFRYPHFLVGRQPSYPLPPPATIYGHICSAVGNWVDPASLRFGYSFRHSGRGDDLEHIHVATVGTGRPSKAWPYPQNLEVNINPLPRELLFAPHLTLYLHTDDHLDPLLRAFREPRYPVVLGRSQDLASYRSVEVIQLEQASAGYFEGALLPASFRHRTTMGINVLMPQFIDPVDRRRVSWRTFLALEGRAVLPDPGVVVHRGGIVQRDGDDEVIWVDPASPPMGGRHRIVVWHGFTANESDVVRLAPASA